MTSLQSSDKELPQSTSVKKHQEIEPSTNAIPQVHSSDGKQSIRRVADSNLDEFQEGAIKSVYFGAINSLSDIYFTLEDEFKELDGYYDELK